MSATKFPPSSHLLQISFSQSCSEKVRDVKKAVLALHSCSHAQTVVLLGHKQVARTTSELEPRDNSSVRHEASKLHFTTCGKADNAVLQRCERAWRCWRTNGIASVSTAVLA